MRNNYPLSSQLLNNKLLLSYENLVYLLGQSIDGQPYYSGLYEKLEESNANTAICSSGILTGTISTQVKMINLLKFDYFYRKNFNLIRD